MFSRLIAREKDQFQVIVIRICKYNCAQLIFISVTFLRLRLILQNFSKLLGTEKELLQPSKSVCIYSDSLYLKQNWVERAPQDCPLMESCQKVSNHHEIRIINYENVGKAKNFPFVIFNDFLPQLFALRMTKRNDREPSRL